MPSRNEQYLEAAVNKSGIDGLPEPRTRNEKLLHRLVEEVSNRTHWAEENIADVFPEQTLEFVEENGSNGTEILFDLFSFGITEGDQLTVILDGVEYECVLQLFEPAGFLYIGNPAIANSDLPSSGNGEPFVIGFIQNEDVKGAFITTELSGSTHTLQIRALTETVHKLDSKYIPDNIVEHINDTTIHVTSDDKTKWDSHTSDNDIHVTSEERSKWNNSLKLSTLNIKLPSLLNYSTTVWQSVTYGNDTFVAIPSNGTIAAYSSDGITWKKSTLPVSASWQSVTYGGGKFVAVAASSTTTAYSSDGITWKKSTLPVSTSLTSVTYGGGKFVAVSDNAVMHSSDGITWKKSTLPVSASWQSVTYGNDTFVAVSMPDSNTAMYSSGGAIWSTTTLPVSANWKSVTYGGGKFVAVSTTAVYSSDGITWTESTLPVSTSFKSVTYGGGKFVAVGGSSGSPTAICSIDGITWTKTTLPVSTFFNSVTHGNDKFVAIGNKGDAVYSSDGITWKNTFSRLQTVSGTDITEQVKEALQFV